MAIVNLDQLTTEQTYGLKYDLQQINAMIEQENTNIANYNANRPVSEPERSLKPLVTLQEQADKTLSERLMQSYRQLLSYKQSVAINKFNEADVSTQSQVLSILGVPDIVPE